MGAGIRKKAAALLCAAILFALPLNAAAAGGSLVPVGRAVGITLEIDGALVCGFRAVETADGERRPAEESGMKTGDVITEIDGRRVSSAEDLTSVLDDCAGDEMTVTVARRGAVHELKLRPAVGVSGSLELGVLIKDRIAGVGTVTYYDPGTGTYGALGHSVSDPETGYILPLRGGTVASARITAVRQGEGGKPGELAGSFSTEGIGSVELNTEFGVFGTAYRDAFGGETLPTAEPCEIKEDRAELIATVAGSEPERYEIKITRIFGRGAGRDMLVEVTDERLIALTGGIVRGMSGCPVIQNGKLVGAVTHVLVNEPTKGYAVSIERMLEAAA